MKMTRVIILVVFSFLIINCSRKRDTYGEEDILVSVKDSVLFKKDVEMLIPGGLTPEDSAEMFRVIVDRWVETRVLEEVARENVVDLGRIDRMASEYRNRLIVDEYLRKIGNNMTSEISKKAIEDYYRQFGDSMRLEQPLVKGIFLRTTANDRQLDNIRRWISSASEEDIDELEKRGLKEATGYEYFADRWVEWSEVSQQIPVKIEDADEFLKNNRDFETSSGGSVYFLHVLEWEPTGNVMPKDFAFSCISDILSQRYSGDYRKNLLRSIYREAVKDGKLKKGSYDPMERLR